MAAVEPKYSYYPKLDTWEESRRFLKLTESRNTKEGKSHSVAGAVEVGADKVSHLILLILILNVLRRVQITLSSRVWSVQYKCQVISQECEHLCPQCLPSKDSQ